MTPGQKIAIGTQILKARLTGTARPFFIQYSLLNACNVACGYCNSPHRRDPQLPTRDHLEILREFARLGAMRIKFLGGEPLLRRDLGELADHVRALGMRSAMVTNALFAVERFDVVRRIDEIIISLDGSERVHDRQRGAGTWKRVMAAIERCAEARLDFFLSAVVTRYSAVDIDWLLATAKRLGVMINFQVPQFNVEVYGEQAREWMPTPDEIREIVARIIAAKRAGAPVLFTERSYRRTLEWTDFSAERVERSGERSPCTAGTYFLQMEPNGDIYPCVLHIGTFTPKNVIEHGVEAAWRHAQHHSCFDCYNTWLNENRAIFALQPAVLSNFWRNYLAGPPR